MRVAAQLKLAPLWLWTDAQEKLYASLGWQTLDVVEYSGAKGGKATVMQCDPAKAVAAFDAKLTATATSSAVAASASGTVSSADASPATKSN